jgi:hypothetical protein
VVIPAFFKDQNDLPDETKDPVINTNSLEIALRKKKEKYVPIIEYATDIISNHRIDLMNMYKISDMRVYVHYVIISSLGVVPKTTIQTLNNIFRLRGRVETQTMNIIAKRCSMSVLK